MTKRDPPTYKISATARIRPPIKSARAPLPDAPVVTPDKTLPRKYPFPLLQIGESFFVRPKEGEALTKLASRVRAIAAYWQPRLKARYQTARVKRNKGVRVKRIE
jgi:hypothetical protein